jgi:hypothetical protein
MLRLDRRTRGILIDVEVRRECTHKSIDVPFHQCNDKVEIAGHARLAVIPKRKRARQHERNISCGQSLADYSENIEFLVSTSASPLDEMSAGTTGIARV